MSVPPETNTIPDARTETGTSGKKDHGHSIAPLVGYEPTYKFVVGGAYFYEDSQFHLGIDTNTNFGQVYQTHATIHYDINPRYYAHLHTSFTKGFDPYYGEGGHTEPQNFVKLWGYHGHTKAQFAIRPDPVYSVGLFWDARYRAENDGPGSPPQRVFGDETTVGFGFFHEVDTRDNQQSPRDGFVLRNDFTFVPEGFSNDKRRTFGQIDGSLIVYKEILNQIVRDVIAAFQVEGGISFGEPSYMFMYQLGGTHRLRGYHENRFRGKAYYLQQTELRFPLWKLFSGAAYVGFGDTSEFGTSDKAAVAKMSYGIGLRIGLPPDYISKIRIDYGVGQDQRGIFADFGHTF